MLTVHTLMCFTYIHLTFILFPSYMRIFVQTRQKTATEDWWQLCKWLRTLAISDTTQQCVNLWVNVTGKVALLYTMKAISGAPLILNFITQLLELSLASQSLYPPLRRSPQYPLNRSLHGPKKLSRYFWRRENSLVPVEIWTPLV